MDKKTGLLHVLKKEKQIKQIKWVYFLEVCR